MPKLHKFPAVRFRRVENDRLNPFSLVAKYTAALLEEVVKNACWTNVVDSREVIAKLCDLELPIQEGQQSTSKGHSIH